jgi:raffinose/stachyose/melibiose transport system substrate-binding protein
MPKLNANTFGAFLLIASFFVSLWIVMQQTGTLDRISGREVRVVRFLHWQLEPGFREALEEVIQKYNALPHVQEAGYMVQQIAISEKFYSQFLNTHLISGTAPDLSTRGKASLASQIDQFFEPLGAFVEEPNPFNTEETVPTYLPQELRERLIHGPWRETFRDALQSGYDESLKNYYAIPISNWGPIRLYYNRGIIRRAKDLLIELLDAPNPRPAWLEARLIPPGGTTADGWLPETPELHAWLRGDEAVDTLGRLMLISDAIRQLAILEERRFLVPISGSAYTRDVFADMYAPPFFHSIAVELDRDKDSSLSPFETFGSWAVGDWSFEDEQIRAYFETLREIASHFPRGFLGLDREQANRRFIMRNAAMLLTGGWDASSIFSLARDQAEPFDVGVGQLPVAGPGERFYEFANQRPSEAAQALGVPMALYKLSEMKEEALDFLRFLTSYQGNQLFVQRSGWLPATIGVEPTEEMRPFTPNPEGIINTMRLNFTGGNVATVYRGQLYLFIGGDITYDEFVNNVETAMGDPRMGVNRLWFETFIRDAQMDRNTQMSMSTEALRYLTGLDPEAEERYFQVLQRSLSIGNGMNNRMLWRHFFPDEPHPEF